MYNKIIQAEFINVSPVYYGRVSALRIKDVSLNKLVVEANKFGRKTE